MPLSVLAGEIALAVDEIASVCAGVGEGLRRRAAAAASDLTVLTGPDAVEVAAPAWSALEAAGGLATPFQSLALARAASAVHLARGERPHIAIVREAGQPVVLLAGVLARWGGVQTVRFLGDPLIQYGDALAAPAAQPRHLDAAWSAFADSRVASLALCSKVRADARIAPLLARASVAIGRDEAPFVDLRRPSALAARDARELRRFRRRLEERGALAFEIARGRDAIRSLQEAIRLKRDWLAERGLASRVIGDPDWEAVLMRLARAHGEALLAAARLTVGGEAAAIEIGLVRQGCWHAFLGATAPAFAKAGPGHVQMAETIAHCRQSGLAVYDLLAPAQPYKRMLASGTIAVSDHAVPLDLRGRLALWAVRLRPAAKRALAAMPAGLRRAIAKAVLDGRKG